MDQNQQFLERKKKKIRNKKDKGKRKWGRGCTMLNDVCGCWMV
jgi:hypothetical protein